MKFSISNKTSSAPWSKSGIWAKLKKGLEENAPGVKEAIREEYAAVEGDITKDSTESQMHLPHHFISDDGVLTLSINGLHAAAARFNQTQLPDELKAKAKAHLRRHYKQIGEDIPDVLKASTKITFNADNVQISVDQKHPNKLMIAGTVAYIDKPSDGVPCGCELPLVLTREAVEKSIDTLNFMGIDCKWDEMCSPDLLMTDHDMRNIVGVVQRAYIEDSEIKFNGIVYQNNFPDLAFFIKNAMDSLGFSIEGYITTTSDGQYEYADSIVFTGVAILFKNTAAFKNTYIEYVAAKNKKKEGDSMNEEQLKEFFDKMMNNMKESIDAVKAELSAKVDAYNKKIDEIKKELADEYNKKIDEIKNELKVKANEQPEDTKQPDNQVPNRVTAANEKVVEAKFAESKEVVNKIWASGSKDTNDWIAKMTQTIEAIKKDINSSKIV